MVLAPAPVPSLSPLSLPPLPLPHGLTQAPGWPALPLPRSPQATAESSGTTSGASTARAAAVLTSVLRDPDPRAVAERSGAVAKPEAVAALRQMLESRAFFHEATDELERRVHRRDPH